MPLTRWTHYRKARAQKKKALHLLSLSGVVRPSTIELRYAVPLSTLSVELLHDEQTTPVQNASTSAIAIVSRRSTEITHLARHLYSTAFTLLAKSRRQLHSFQWDTRNAA